MSKLLRAGFIRLFRLKSLYVCLAVIAFQHLTNAHIESTSPLVTDGYMELSINDHLTETAFLIMVLAAIVIGNLIGAEYSFGTMRNKLAVGHDRTGIYLSNFIVSLTGTLTLLAFGYIIVFAALLPVGGIVDNTDGLLIKKALLDILFCVVITALYVFIAMNVQSKSNSLTAAIILGVLMILANLFLSQQLHEPELIEMPDGTGSNPYYVSGARRTFYEVSDTFLPCSSVLEYTGEVETDKVIAELCETVIFTAAGMLVFRRSDLK